MQIRLDHLYRETHHWVDSVAFWSNLGFSFAEEWGEEPHRAGRLVRGGASIVLAEVAGSDEASQTTFLATDDLEGLGRQAGEDVVDTHWGTRMVTITDPDGRVYNIEPGSFDEGGEPA